MQMHRQAGCMLTLAFDSEMFYKGVR
jgi:hypothetical protein